MTNPFASYLMALLFSYIGIIDRPLLLSPFIRSGDITKARLMSRVIDSSGVIPKSYSGFITADHKLGNHLFFWFFPPEGPPHKRPLLVWLNGGPGASSMAGLFYENGPLEIHPNGTYTPRLHSWTASFSMLYVDNPVGTGFSYSESESKGYRTSQAGYTQDLYSFLRQFYVMFPEYLSTELYIGGQSYAGKYVSSLGYLLHSKIKSGMVKLPFSGIYLGNPFFDPQTQSMMAVDFYYSMGALSSVQREDYKTKCSEFWKKVAEKKQLKPFYETSTFQEISHLIQDHYLKPDDISAESLNQLMNSQEMKQVVHTGDRIFKFFDGLTYEKLQSEQTESTKDKMAVLMSNYKVLIYTGEFDGRVPTVSVEESILTTKWSHQKDYNNSYRKIWSENKIVENGRLYGYFTKTGQFCRVVIHNAGHHVPYDQPDVALRMMQHFVKYGCIEQSS